mgnify:CR=1 FL=1
MASALQTGVRGVFRAPSLHGKCTGIRVVHDGASQHPLVTFFGSSLPVACCFIDGLHCSSLALLCCVRHSSCVSAIVWNESCACPQAILTALLPSRFNCHHSVARRLAFVLMCACRGASGYVCSGCTSTIFMMIHDD